MNEKVQKFLNEQKAKERAQVLLSLGMYEKVYSPHNLYTANEYCLSEWSAEENKTKFYKKVPIEITDEEFEQVKKYANRSSATEINPIASTLTAIAWITFIVGFIAGIMCANVEVVKGVYYTYTDTEFSFAIAFTYWSAAFISGMMFLGFAEIIKLLTAIKNK